VEQIGILQLDQYDKQLMFGTPVITTDRSAIFHLVWTYIIKEPDGCKKARCVCDGSPRSGQVQILDHTYANCVNHTGSCLFYAILVAKNMLIYGANASNAFAEALPPNQGFYLYPNRAFKDWWIHHKKNPPIPTWACDLSPWRYARPPRITSPLGKACQKNPPHYRLHPNCPQTLHLIWHDTQQMCPLHATG
jgi:hypothetical protein